MYVIFISLFVGIVGFPIIYWGVRWIKNNRSPVLTEHAMVLSMQLSVQNTYDRNDRFRFVYFRSQSFTSKELHMSLEQYAMLHEGDWGELSYQGTRFLGFKMTDGSVEV